MTPLTDFVAFRDALRGLERYPHANDHDHLRVVHALRSAATRAWNDAAGEGRDRYRDLSDLSPQLVGLEGWRVEVITCETLTKRRFIVGRSTGWRPCHLEVLRRSSSGGAPARKRYFSVKKLEKVR